MTFIDKTPYKLVDWVDINKLNWRDLNLNPRAIQLLEKNKEHIYLHNLMLNPNAIFIIEENVEKISLYSWKLLSSNPNAIELLEENIDKIDWWQLSSNPSAIQIIEKNLDKVKGMMLCKNPNAFHLLKGDFSYENIENNWGWWGICGNSSKESIKILEENINKNFHSTELIARALSENQNAVHLLEKYPEYINWAVLSSNPNAVHLLEKNQDKLNWFSISSNPNASRMIKENIPKYKIDMNWLSKNPCIFEIDYDAIKEKTKIEIFEEELMQKCYHPKRLINYLYNYNYDIGDDIYITETI